jgi:hypothetical protein
VTSNPCGTWARATKAASGRSLVCVESALALLILLGLGAVTSVGVAVALTYQALSRHNRVAARVRTGAPLSWLFSARLAPRMHRRLCAVVRNAQASCPRVSRRAPRSTVHELVDDLVELAAAADRRLVDAAGLPRFRRALALAEIAGEIREIETLSVRVRQYGSVGAPATVSVASLQERLDALDAARREIDGIDWTRAS